MSLTRETERSCGYLLEALEARYINQRPPQALTKKELGGLIASGMVGFLTRKECEQRARGLVKKTKYGLIRSLARKILHGSIKCTKRGEMKVIAAQHGIDPLALYRTLSELRVEAGSAKKRGEK